MGKAVRKRMRGAPEPGAPAPATGHSPRILFPTAFPIDFSRFEVHFSCSVWVLRRDSISAHVWYGLRTYLPYRKRGFALPFWSAFFNGGHFINAKAPIASEQQLSQVIPRSARSRPGPIEVTDQIPHSRWTFRWPFLGLLDGLFVAKNGFVVGQLLKPLGGCNGHDKTDCLSEIKYLS